MTELDPIDRLLAIAECTRLMVEYGLRLDHDAAVSTAELFTEDGAWRSNTIDAVGQVQLREFFQRRADLTERLTRHVVTNIAVDLIDADHARGRSIALEVRDDRGTDGLGEDTGPRSWATTSTTWCGWAAGGCSPSAGSRSPSSAAPRPS